MTSLVFDLGGTHLRSAVAFGDGSLSHVTKERLLTVSDGVGPDEVWQRIRERLSRYVKDHIDRTAAGSPIVVSFPGPIDEAGRILQAPTLTGGDAQIPNIQAELESLSNRPVHLLNDLSAAAWYLSGFTAGRFMVVTVSSGIGSKVFDPTVGVLDDVPYAGEIGHTVADRSSDAVRCDCGGRGHLGAIASGRGIERRARQLAQANPRRFAQSECAYRYGATPETLCNERHLVPALQGGDEWATQLVAHSLSYLACSLTQAIVVAGLRSVVVIGGFALAGGHIYLNLLRAAAKQCCDYDLLSESIAGRLTLGSLGEEACLLGAGVYAKKMVRP